MYVRGEEAVDWTDEAQIAAATQNILTYWQNKAERQYDFEGAIGDYLL